MSGGLDTLPLILNATMLKMEQGKVILLWVRLGRLKFSTARKLSSEHFLPPYLLELAHAYSDTLCARECVNFYLGLHTNHPMRRNVLPSPYLTPKEKQLIKQGGLRQCDSTQSRSWSVDTVACSAHLTSIQPRSTPVERYRSRPQVLGFTTPVQHINNCPKCRCG